MILRMIIAIDDFVTKYFWLTRLLDYRSDTLKIDRGFLMRPGVEDVAAIAII
jgi:EAL domain-containing protein (putative c-di-GMP-specific phosphodiesterase class I)